MRDEGGDPIGIEDVTETMDIDPFDGVGELTLHSAEGFADVVLLAPRANSHRVEARSGQRCLGVFGILGGVSLALVAREGRLFLYRDGATSRVWPPEERLSVVWRRRGGRLRRLVVSAHREVVLDVTCEVPEWRIEGDFTMVDEEDFDFGLLISNILNSTERMALCVDAWEEGRA